MAARLRRRAGRGLVAAMKHRPSHLLPVILAAARGLRRMETMGDPARRLVVVQAAVAVFLGLFLVRLWELQLTQWVTYARKAAGNRTQVLRVEPPRGLIFDRNGVKLADNEFVQRLVEAGLDHFQITLESHDESIHNRMVGADSWRDTVQGIKNAVDTPVYTITNTTLTKLNTANIEQTVEFISSLGIEVMACNGIIYSGAAKEAGIGLRETELGGILGRIRNKTQQLGMRLIWYTPTRYCEFNPLQLELGAKQCTAGKFNMCIEPDGEVIPCQSYYSSVGNILRDKWKSIWNHPLLVELRERKFVMEKCKQCDQLPICGGGCPLSLKKEGVICTESMSNG